MYGLYLLEFHSKFRNSNLTQPCSVFPCKHTHARTYPISLIDLYVYDINIYDTLLLSSCEYNTHFTTEANPVLLGYDVVEYHYIKPYKEGGVAVRGRPKYAYNFNGYQFWFSSERNLFLFKDNPWKYAPAWGGFCSWGVALELPPRWPWQVRVMLAFELICCLSPAHPSRRT